MTMLAPLPRTLRPIRFDQAELSAAPPESVAVLLINYNSGAYLAQALASVARQNRQPEEIIIVDNGSTDGSLGLVDWTQHPQARLICLPENLGFAAASNVAAQAARCQWLAMLNSDASAEPDWIEAMLAAHQRHPTCKIFASAQTSLDHPSRLDGAGDVYSVTGLSWRGAFGAPTTTLPSEGRCFGACAAGAFISRREYLALGGFEESFFCYLEDVDFAYRAQLAGLDCTFVPSARIQHKGGGSSGAKSAWTLRISARNRIHLYLRNTPLLLIVLTWPLFLLGLFIGLLQGLRHGGFLAVLFGIKDAMLRLPETLDQRRRLAPPKVPPRAMLSRLSWNPFAVFRRSHGIKPLRAPELCDTLTTTPSPAAFPAQ